MDIKLKLNKIKKNLNEGKVVYGACVNSFNPSIIEIAGFCGLDWCRIDNEHAWRQDSSLENCIRGAVIGNILPIVRVERGDMELIKKVLEIGAVGFVIPHVKRSEEVEEIVAAAKFPPLGTRGISNRGFSGCHGVVKPTKEFIDWGNESLVGVMIEDKEAVENIDEIMKVKGLDFVLFGPSDYSLSIGLEAPNWNHPEVQEAIKRTGKFAKKHGKYASIPISRPWKEESKKYIEMGYSILELGADYTLLAEAWKESLKELKS